MNRFNNPLKLQKGGSAGKDQLVKIFQDAAKNAQVDPEALVQKAQEIGQDEEAAAQFIQGLQLCAKGDPQGIQYIQGLFKQAYKAGGKILDFICKHAKGGYVAGCGCNVEKAEKGTKAKVPFLADMMTYFTGKKTPDVGSATNRSFGYSRLGGNQYYRETADIDGNTTDTYMVITPEKDTLIRQVLPSGRVNNLDALQRETIMKRFRPDIQRINSKQNGGPLKDYSAKRDKNGRLVEKAFPLTREISAQGDTTLTVGSNNPVLLSPYTSIIGKKYGPGFADYTGNRFVLNPEVWKKMNADMDAARNPAINNSSANKKKLVNVQLQPQFITLKSINENK